MVMKVQVPQYFLTSWGTTSVWRRSLLPVVSYMKMHSCSTVYRGWSACEDLNTVQYTDAGMEVLMIHYLIVRWHFNRLYIAVAKGLKQVV